mmetsp:Transcript_85998/g.257689  ORF Transcript_85998/g.257689 Transcript_85998/m.257689 type:complete len:304 (-) Transcript_85998:447-1358(-)
MPWNNLAALVKHGRAILRHALSLKCGQQRAALLWVGLVHEDDRLLLGEGALNLLMTGGAGEVILREEDENALRKCDARFELCEILEVVDVEENASLRREELKPTLDGRGLVLARAPDVGEEQVVVQLLCQPEHWRLAGLDHAQSLQAFGGECTIHCEEHDGAKGDKVDAHHRDHQAVDRIKAEETGCHLRLDCLQRCEQRDAQRHAEGEGRGRLEAERYHKHVVAFVGTQNQQKDQIGGGGEHANQVADEEFLLWDPLHKPDDKHALGEEEHLPPEEAFVVLAMQRRGGGDEVVDATLSERRS